MCPDTIRRGLNILAPQNRRRLWADHASELGKYLHSLRDVQPKDLDESTLELAVAMAIENGLELHVQDIAPDRIAHLADEYQELQTKAKNQFPADRWENVICNWNSKRGAAQGYLFHTYDCSGEDWVDTCEEIWQENLDKVLLYVDSDYCHSLTAELYGSDITIREQADQLADVFRAMVAGGNVRLVDHDVAIQWGEMNIERARERGLKAFL